MLACRAVALRKLVIVFFEFAVRTARDKNVAVNLHHLLSRYSTACVQVVDVLRDEQKIVRALGESRDCFVRGIRPGIADTLPSLAIPIPN